MRPLDPIAAIRLSRVTDTGFTVAGVDYDVGIMTRRSLVLGAAGAAVGGLLGALGSHLTKQPHPGTHALMGAAGGFAGAFVAGVWSAIADFQHTANPG